MCQISSKILNNSTFKLILIAIIVLGENKMKNKQTFLFVSIILISCLITALLLVKVIYYGDTTLPIIATKPDDTYIEPTDTYDTSFDFTFIREVNKHYETNYLVSPMSVATAFSMLSDGTSGESKKQIDDTIGKYIVPKINIPNRVGIANALFINNSYKKSILDSYIDTLKNKYDSEVLFDSFESPDVINNWVNEKTYKMIPKVLDEISPNFVFGLSNAIAIDVDWYSQFSCSDTEKGEFTTYDNKKIDAVMMHDDDSEVGYFENDEAYGIVKDYLSFDLNGNTSYEDSEGALELEYIAIMPKGDIKEYINNFGMDKLNKLYESKEYSTSKLKYYLSLPRYSYDFDLTNFSEIMKNLGIKDVFDPSVANFENTTTDPNLDLYVGTAIHKTHIDLNEKGTKAAAVTFLGVFDNAVPLGYETKYINFDKPFIYLIKDKNSDNIWFFGTVYEPELWTNETVTCSENE